MSSRIHSRSSTSPLFLIFSLLLFSSSALFGEPLENQESYRVEHLSTWEGLSGDSVNSLLQDHLGWMWFGTSNGLNRYDGHRFTVYRNDPFNPYSLSDNKVITIYEDRQKTLWVGTAQGLNRFDRAQERFERILSIPGESNSLSHGRVNVIYEDSSGALWLGTHRGGLDKLVRGTGKITHYPHDPENPNSLSANEVWAIHEDSFGILWVGTDLGGLNRFDPVQEEWTRYLPDPERADSLSHNEVRAIVEDGTGSFWLATKGGLERFDRERGTFEHFRHHPLDPGSLSNDKLYALIEDSSGVLWAGTNQGLNRFHRESEQFSILRPEQDQASTLSDLSIRCLYEDRSGVLWAGTSKGGVNKIYRAPNPFRHYDIGADNGITTLAARSDKLWFGVYDEGLVELDLGTGQTHRHRRAQGASTGLSGTEVWDFSKDDAEALWIGGAALDRLDQEARQITNRLHLSQLDLKNRSCFEEQSFDVRALEFVSPHTIWLGTDCGLLRYDLDSEAVEQFLHDPIDPQSLSNNRISTILEKDDGTLWIGTDSGLNRFLDGRFESFRHDPTRPETLSSNLIHALYSDSQGTLWVGTGQGLNRFVEQSTTFRGFTEDHGLANHWISCIEEDEAGNLWLATNRGLTRFDPRSEVARNYDEDDGLPYRRFLSCARAPNGDLFFASLPGLVAFDPRQLPKNPHPPNILLTSFKIFNQEVALDAPISQVKELKLSYRDNFFSFEFAALDHVAPNKNQYAYRLVGVDKDWIYSGNRYTASYTNVDPGTYVFRVRGSNNDGVWNEDGVTLAISITPPFWRTWWFLLASTLGLLLLIFFAHQIRTQRIRRHRDQLERNNRLLNQEITRRQRFEAEREHFIAELENKKGELEAQNGELERFTYTISHDLKSPLVTIQGFLGLLERDVAKGDAQRVERDVHRISKAAERMARLLDELLELSRIGRVMHPPEEVSLGTLAQEATEQVAGQITARGVAVVISPALPVVLGDRPRLLEVFQNLVDNAVKFMGEQADPRIEIGCREDSRGETILFVRDNGVGIDTQYQEKVFGLFERLNIEVDGTGIGLALIKRIINVHGGRIWVESEGLGKGSTFCFTLPASGPA